MLAIKTLLAQQPRFLLTVFGIALCVILMLFLLSIYKGVSVGSVEYVRESQADLWVLQRYSTNIVRSTSVLPVYYKNVIKNIKGVKSVAPVLFILASVNTEYGPATVYLTGFDPETGIGGPPSIYKGSNLTENGQIILDRSFAAKYRINIGDRIPVRDDTLSVAGLSTGTNMFVVQYTYTTLKKAHSIVGFPGMVSCFQVLVEPGNNPSDIAGLIKREISDIAVFDRKNFLANNIHEMESGLLPLLYVVAFIGAVVLTAILSLILSVNVLERRKDYAIMKALGSPGRFIPGTVIQQALVLAGCGTAVALILFFPLTEVVEKLSPEVSVVSSLIHVLIVMVGVGLISLVSSFIPIRKLRNIYPLEVFK
jgi:putative ABC transport system permease protein